MVAGAGKMKLLDLAAVLIGFAVRFATAVAIVDCCVAMSDT